MAPTILTPMVVREVDRVDSRVEVRLSKFFYPFYAEKGKVYGRLETNDNTEESSLMARSTHMRLVVRGDLLAEEAMMMNKLLLLLAALQ